MLILKTNHSNIVIEKYNMFMKILQKIKSREELINFLEQYTLYLNIVLTQLSRLKDFDKHVSLTNRLNELKHFFLSEVL